MCCLPVSHTVRTYVGVYVHVRILVYVCAYAYSVHTVWLWCIRAFVGVLCSLERQYSLFHFLQLLKGSY